MAQRRLSDSEKQDLVGRYKAGESTSALAEAFGCSPNTVSRTVKSLLPAEAYAALKARRLKGGASARLDQASPGPTDPDPVVEPEPAVAVASSSEPDNSNQDSDSLEDQDDGKTLALDDADDFGVDIEDDLADDDESPSVETFTELVPLEGVGDLSDRRFAEVQSVSAAVLPPSVYMLVDKVVELDARPLKDFPELGPLDDAELERQGLVLFVSPRAAKRQCGRSQRVIKIPDTGVFERTSSFLLARGITRLVMEGTLIALDA